MWQTYLSEVIRIYQTGGATEHSYRTPLQNLLNAFIKEQNIKNVEVLHEPQHSDFGAPDFRIIDNSNTTIGYVECKTIGTSLTETLKSEQLKRYIDITPNLILTNYLDFVLIRNGVVVQNFTIASELDLQQHKIQIRDISELSAMIDIFLKTIPERIKNVKQLSIELAKRTHLLRELIQPELVSAKEKKLYSSFYTVFRNALFNSLTEEQFADIYAQIIGFGLLFLRFARDKDLTRDNILSNIPEYIPLLRDFFPNTHFDEWPDHIVWVLDEMLELLNHMDVKFIKESISYKKLSLLEKRDSNRKDPFLYFYEEFLTLYDKKLKIERGVFYTPEAVVSYIIRSIDEILINELGMPKGVLDTNLKVLDFATGTGTFILAWMELVMKRVIEENNMGLMNSIVSDYLLKKVYGFEFLIVPYILCHFRIHEFLQSEYSNYALNENERAQIYLTNTLENEEPHFTEFFSHIDNEGKLADKAKNEEEIIVIMGNPPYSVSSSNNTTFISDLMKSYKTAVKGEKNIQPLSDDYIKFIRFAQWKMENVAKGVIGIITNNSYLDGLIHRGMREELLKSFDKIYILNLHGNSSIVEKCPDGSKDENVFDIKQGVCIVFLIKSDNSENGIFYSNLMGLRDLKYEFLYKSSLLTTDFNSILPSPPNFWLTDIVSEINDNEYCISIDQIFEYKNSGVKTHHDNELLSLTKDAVFSSPYLYRPFDIRFINYDRNKVERPRYELMKNFINVSNIGLVTTRQYVEQCEFNHVFITSILTDTRITTSNRGAGFIFPLFTFDDTKRSNIKSSFTKFISTLYQDKVISEMNIVAYLYAILYTPSYRTKYRESLKIDFPHIPFTSDYTEFCSLSEQGQRLIDLHLMKADPKPMNSSPCFPVAHADLYVSSVKFVPINDLDGKVWINDTTYFDRIPLAVWNYYIGGYQVAEKWLKERKKHKYTLTGADVSHFLQVCAVLSETIEIQKKLDVLASTFIDSR